MGAPLFKNNAECLLGADLSTSSTTLVLETGKEDLFSSPSAGDYQMLTIYNKALNKLEILKCTAKSGVNCTIVRAQEGTQAESFTVASGSAISARATAGVFDYIKDGILSAKSLTNTLESDLLAAGGASKVGMKRTDVSLAVETTLGAYHNLQEFRFRSDAGGIGNGASDDATITANHAAAQLISGWINANGGGKIIIEYGDYKFGKQDFAGSTGLGYAYRMRQMFKFLNCTKPVIFEFQGAKLSLKNGVKFGSYNPVTGLAYIPTLPFTNIDYWADAGNFVEATGCSAGVFFTSAGVIDGNKDNVALGGQWGDTGYQIYGYGLRLYGNSINSISPGFVVKNCCTDNVILDTVHQYRDAQNIVIGLTCDGAGRNNLSLVGGRSNLIVSSKFNNAGQGLFGSAPASGVDVESEQPVGEAPGKGITRTHFLLCEFYNNRNTGSVADSGNSSDLTYEKSKFVSIAGTALWLNKPNIKVLDCDVFGGVLAVFPGTYFWKIRFNDYIDIEVNPPSGEIDIDSVESVMEDCVIDLWRTEKASMKNMILRRVVINIHSGTELGTANQDWKLNLTGSTLEDCTINDLMTNTPADAYYIITTNMISKGVNTLNSAGKLKWGSWSAGAGGFTGIYGENDSRKRGSIFTKLMRTSSSGTLESNYYGTHTTVLAVNNAGLPTGFPTGYVPSNGDLAINQDYVSGTPREWRYKGSTSTWVSQGNFV